MKEMVRCCRRSGQWEGLPKAVVSECRPEALTVGTVQQAGQSGMAHGNRQVALRELPTHQAPPMATLEQNSRSRWLGSRVSLGTKVMQLDSLSVGEGL